jgi:tripartite-type tricarboxylate transporter receptor subunit TctC
MIPAEYILRVAALCLAGVCACVQAQSYPSRPVRLIAPYVAGGGTDFVARTVATKLSELWGSPVVVENRPGGGTNIGSELVARAAPDGYTLLVGGVPNTVNMSLYRKLPYDVVKDFAPVIHLDTAPNVLAVHPSLPVKSVKDLIALAKKNPGTLNFGSAGIGSSNHLSGELFKVMAAIDIVHVPYKGGAAAVTDLLAGQITMYFGTTPSTMPLVRAGRLRGLAVTTARRSSVAPELPTMAEAALPGFEQSAWHGIFAPAGTPAAVVGRLNADLNALLKSADVTQRFASQGIEVTGGSTAEFAAFIKQDLAKYQKLVRSAGIKVE